MKIFLKIGMFFGVPLIKALVSGKAIDGKSARNYCSIRNNDKKN